MAINSPYMASFNECACFENPHTRRASAWVFPFFAGQQKQGIADIPRPSTPNFYNRVSCDLTSWVWFKWKRTKTGSERVDSGPEGKILWWGCEISRGGRTQPCPALLPPAHLWSVSSQSLFSFLRISLCVRERCSERDCIVFRGSKQARFPLTAVQLKWTTSHGRCGHCQEDMKCIPRGHFL